MDIVLSILGTILIGILIIVLVLLLLLAIILFVPICYKISGAYQENLTVSGRVTWLGAIVFLRFSYLEGETETSFRIFGVDVQKFLEKRKRRKEKRAKRNTKKTERAERNTEKTERAKRNMKKAETGKETGKSLQREKDVSNQKALLGKEHRKNETIEAKKEVKESKYQKLVRNILYRWNCIKKFVRSIYRLLKSIRDKMEWANNVRKFLQEDNTKRMVCIIKDNVIHLWRKLKPRVLRGKVEFGMDDPCLTGEILGVAALFYAYYGSGIQVIPDFEEARLEGNLFVKGRISLITIVVILIHILFSKEWNQFKSDIDQLKEAL